jgi:hypothetical protein
LALDGVGLLLVSMIWCICLGGRLVDFVNLTQLWLWADLVDWDWGGLGGFDFGQIQWVWSVVNWKGKVLR